MISPVVCPCVTWALATLVTAIICAGTVALVEGAFVVTLTTITVGTAKVEFIAGAAVVFAMVTVAGVVITMLFVVALVLDGGIATVAMCTGCNGFLLHSMQCNSTALFPL